MTKGKVFIIGAGPGDPGLITKKGFDLLRSAQVVVMDALVDPALVKGIRAKIIFAGKRGPGAPSGAYKQFSQEKINQLLVRLGRRGRRVVRLKGGDPFIFGRGMEEAEALAKAGIAYDVVPGVTSGIGVPALAGIPLTDRRLASQVSFITGHSKVDWSRLSPRGTLVVFMGVGEWPKIRKKLLSRGFYASLPVAAIESGSTSSQRVLISTLKDSQDEFRRQHLFSPALIVVGKVVNLRRAPLSGKTIIVTRPKAQAGELTELLKDQGADVILSPAIHVESLLGNKPVTLPGCDIILFLSSNTVQLFTPVFQRFKSQFKGPTMAIGPSTAQSLDRAGWKKVVQVPQHHTQGILRFLKNVRGKRILIPRVENAPAALVNTLKKRGAKVTELSVYRTHLLPPTKEARRALQSGCDAVTFTSASCVKSFERYFSLAERKKIFNRTLAVSLGPQTTTALKKIGIRNISTARISSLPGLVQTLSERLIA